MSTPHLLGIDVGTTTCRCAVFDLTGRPVAMASQEMAVRYPRPLWAEIDPEVWWLTCVEVIHKVLECVPPDAIGAVGLSGLMHAPVLLDAADCPLGPTMLWMDQRCAPQSAAMDAEAADHGRPEFDSTTVSAPKLRWIVENRPDLLARARTFVLPKDYIRIRLTGIGGTDASDAVGTGLFDRDREAWMPRAIELSRVPPALLPEVRPASALAGRVTEAAAAETGLQEGTPVAYGGSDVYCTKIALGPFEVGEVCLYMGTAAWMSFVGGHRPDGQPIFRGSGRTAATGAALRWARDLLAVPLGVRAHASYEAVLDGVERIAPGAEGLLFLPHLMGERGPRPDPLARGALVGLTLRHGPPHIIRALLEGTAFQIRRNLDAHAPERVRGGIVAGGAAKSPLWMQILVDILGIELRSPACVEASVLGAAMLGGVAGLFFSLSDGQALMLRPGRTYRPNPERVVRYGPLYGRYCQVDEMLMPGYAEWEMP